MTQDSPLAELWEKVPNWPYEASNLGRIRRTADEDFHGSGSIVEPWVKGQKYPMVVLYRPAARYGGRETWAVAAHRVVAEAWLGPMPAPGWEVDHVDGDRHNRHVDNLEWVPPGENIRRAVARGHRGENRWNAKLNEDLVRQIRRLRADGLSVPAIAERIGASESSVSHVVAGRSWRHVQPEERASELARQ